MKRTGIKKHLVILISMLLLAVMMSSTVMAASVYVPVEGTVSDDKDTLGTWMMTIAKNGNVTSSNFKLETSPKKTTYVWNKTRLKKVDAQDPQTPGAPGHHIMTYKYKNGLLSSFKENDAENLFTGTYKWTKKKAKFYVIPEGTRRRVRTGTVKINSKNKITQVNAKDKNLYDEDITTSRTDTKYYSNGNIKSITVTRNNPDPENTDFVVNRVRKYNQSGYITSETIEYQDGAVLSYTFKYTMDSKKKCPEEVTITTKNGSTVTYKRTVTFTKFKKVDCTKNCDASGLEVDLGVNLINDAV